MDAAIRASFSALSSSMISLLLPRLASSASSMPTGSKIFACYALAFVERAIRSYSLTNLLVHTSHHMSVLLSLAVADVTDSTATCPQACWAVITLDNYASSVVNASLHIVQQGRGTLLPAVRARLAQPIMTLLHSPLLAHLASLQHVVVSSDANLSRWRFPERSGILPMHQLPSQMQPDAADSDLAMQVGLSGTFLNRFLSYCFPRMRCSYIN